MRSNFITCPECDDPMAVGLGGWGRCRSCGHETLRDLHPAPSGVEAYLAASMAHSAPSIVSAGRVGDRAAAGRSGTQALGLSPLSISDK